MPSMQKAWEGNKMASSSYCYRLVAKYSEALDESKRYMKKNLAEMDLENADIMKDMEDVVKKMMDLCDTLKTSINSYYFE